MEEDTHREFEWEAVAMHPSPRVDANLDEEEDISYDAELDARGAEPEQENDGFVEEDGTLGDTEREAEAGEALDVPDRGDDNQSGPSFDSPALSGCICVGGTILGIS